jgi:hypothetical protein
VSRALHVLSRLRNLAVEDARREVATRLQEAAATAQAERAALDAISRERAIAASLDSDDRIVEAFAAWLSHGMRAVAEAAAAGARAEAAAGQARVRLATARAAAQVIESLLATQAAERQRIADRREQALLDEMGRTRRPDDTNPSDASRHNGPAAPQT